MILTICGFNITYKKVKSESGNSYPVRLVNIVLWILFDANYPFRIRDQTAKEQP